MVTAAHRQDGVDGRSDTAVIVCGCLHQRILFLCIQNTQIQKLAVTIVLTNSKITSSL